MDISRIVHKIAEITNPAFMQRGRTAVYFKIKQVCLEMEADPDYMDLCAAELYKTKILSSSEVNQVEKTLFMTSPAFKKSVGEEKNTERINSLKAAARNFIGMFKIGEKDA